MSIKMLASGVSTFLTIALASGVSYQAIGDHGQSSNQQKPHSGELVQAVRDATRRFRNVEQAESEGYKLMFGCVSGPDDGAMGLHYVNLDLVADGVLDPQLAPRSSSTSRCRTAAAGSSARTFSCSPPTGMPTTRPRRSSADSSCT